MATKKAVPNNRSTASRTAASVTAGTAKTTIAAKTSIDHTKMGIRFNDMPGARSLKIVTIKLIAPTVVDSPTKMMPRPQKSMLTPGEYVLDVSGTYANQPPSGTWPTK